MANLTVKDSTVNLIAGFEGFSAAAFWDYKQWSIGFGSGKMPNGLPVKQGDKVTRAQALEMLKRDVQTFANSVNKLVTSNINQNQFDALVSFCYNLGAGALQSSTLLQLVNANPNDFSRIQTEFMKWINAGGQAMQGLIDRREKEANLYASGAVSASNIIWIVLVVVLFLFIKK